MQGDLGLPNGLAFDAYSSQLCWVDAGDLGWRPCFVVTSDRYPL